MYKNVDLKNIFWLLRYPVWLSLSNIFLNSRIIHCKIFFHEQKKISSVSRIDFVFHWSNKNHRLWIVIFMENQKRRILQTLIVISNSTYSLDIVAFYYKQGLDDFNSPTLKV